MPARRPNTTRSNRLFVPRPIRPVNGYAGAFPYGVEAMDHISRGIRDYAPMHVRWDASHGVMGRGKNRNRLFGRIDAQVGHAEIGNIGKFSQ